MFGLGSQEILLLIFAPFIFFNWIFLSVFGFVSAIVAGIIANSKGRNWGLWGLFSFFIPMLILILLFLKKIPKPGKTKICPACREIIDIQASKCKHCSSDVVI